jgi:hypothetical protein
VLFEGIDDSGSGKTLASELKTTVARGADHALEIDTRQLDRYLNPPAGPPLPGSVAVR